MELTDILNLEATNCRHIYLYNHKNMIWGCYGCSALLLHRIYPNIPYWDRDVSGNGKTLPVMIIDLFTLGDLMERLPPIERDAEKIVIEIPKEWIIR